MNKLIEKYGGYRYDGKKSVIIFLYILKYTIMQIIMFILLFTSLKKLITEVFDIKNLVIFIISILLLSLSILISYKTKIILYKNKYNS
jgi:hypothetical protein